MTDRALPFPLDRFCAFARRQPLEEVAHQYEVLARFAFRRRVLVTLAFGIGLAYQPLWVTLIFFALDCLFDGLTLSLLRGLDPETSPRRYLLAILANTALAVVFATFPALSWLIEDPLAKAYALALVLIALIHHSTLRNVHLPLSVSAAIGASTVAFAFNTWLWASAGQWKTLAITTLALSAAVYYAALTIVSMHRLQAEVRAEREAARQANLAKTRFIAQLSHELRTPLNAIIGLSEAERMMAPLPETKARMEILAESARDLGALLEDILDLSAIEAERLTLHPEALDPRHQIRAAAQLFQRQFEDRGMQIAVEFADDLPQRLWMDGRRLRQCLANVLSNAVKYGGQGLVRIVVTVRTGKVDILVADHGPGVAPALRERIFEPFVRGRADVPGTGLGLSISRMLARRMGGDLVLLPASGQGAEFLLSLPLEPAKTLLLPEPGPCLEGLRVLVVDDIATNRLVAATWLRLLGVETLQAGSGSAALDIAPQERPDVILMDLLMPGLDGVATLRKLRERMGPELPPVLALSAETLPEMAGLSDAGFDGALTKPLTLEALREALAQVSPMLRPRVRA